jgi:hypothetical protein
MRTLLITISLFAGTSVLLNFDNLFVSDAIRKICKEEYELPHWFLFNGDYRKCILNESHQKELVERRRKNIEDEKSKSLRNLDEIQQESIQQAKLIGIDKFLEYRKDIPSFFLFDDPDPIQSGYYPSRFLRKRFFGCDFSDRRVTDENPDPPEFVCYQDVEQNRLLALQGNRWHSNTPVKFLLGDGGNVDLYIEVISIPDGIGYQVRYEVHGFEITESMIVNYFEHQIVQFQEDYSVFLQ